MNIFKDINGDQNTINNEKLYKNDILLYRVF